MEGNKDNEKKKKKEYNFFRMESQNSLIIKRESQVLDPAQKTFLEEAKICVRIIQRIQLEDCSEMPEWAIFFGYTRMGL